MCLKIDRIATGVIPDILDAWDIVSGLILESLSTNSFERPPMDLKSMSFGILIFSSFWKMGLDLHQMEVNTWCLLC